jgi:TrmH family RNA methyltransferase
MADDLPPASTAQLKSARRLVRRKERDSRGQFLVEGPQAISEALASDAELPLLLVTADAVRRYPDLVADAVDNGADCRQVPDRDLAGISQTVHPPGVVGVCAKTDVDLSAAVVTGDARLIVYAACIRDPGNAGTLVRCADAAGAGAVLFSPSSVDLYNPKTVRASTGSIFHLPAVVGADLAMVTQACRDRGFQVLAAAGTGPTRLDDLLRSGALAARTLWLFGNEAHGLDSEQRAIADAEVAVPIHGRAESLNLASAAAICLYASAFAQNPPAAPADPPNASACPPPT